MEIDYDEVARKANEINLVLRMVGVNAHPATCYLIAQTLKVYQKKKGAFSIHDAADLLVTNESLFAGPSGLPQP